MSANSIMASSRVSNCSWTSQTKKGSRAEAREDFYVTGLPPERVDGASARRRRQRQGALDQARPRGARQGIELHIELADVRHEFRVIDHGVESLAQRRHA